MNKENWQEEFNKRFEDGLFFPVPYEDDVWDEITDKVISFIKELLEPNSN